MDSPQLNPGSPLAYLQPSVASQFEVTSYVFYFVLGAYTWDLATNLNSDYHLLFKHRIRISTIVYYASRVATLAYIITSTVFQTSSVGSCQALQVSIGICFAVSMSSTSLLLFLRIRAVFIREKSVVLMFFTLWLALVATLFLVPFSFKSVHLGRTVVCIVMEIKDFVLIWPIINLINDSLIFLAISYRVLSANSHKNDTLQGMMSIFFNASSLPAFSRAVLQGGQQYYLITVGVSIIHMVYLNATKVPGFQHSMFLVPHPVLANAMACIVFRQIKFGLIAPDATSHISKLMVSQRNSSGATLPQFPLSDESNFPESTLTKDNYGVRGIRSSAMDSVNGVQLEIKITKTVEHDSPEPLEIVLPSDVEESYEMETRSED